MSHLIEYDRELLLGWIEPWLLDSKNITDKALMDRFPVLDTMEALCLDAPDVARRIYDILIEQSRNGIISTDGISNFPFQLQASPSATALCQAQLEECTTDVELLELVVRAQNNNRLDWLFDRIQELEQSRVPSEVATAYTLLGFCDVNTRADKLWKDFLGRPPGDCWLDKVIRASYGDYVRNRSARTVFHQFWSSDDPWIARHAMKVVAKQCDMRIGVWIHDIDPNREECEYGRLIARSLATAEIKNAIKKDKDRRKKQLFHTCRGREAGFPAPPAQIRTCPLRHPAPPSGRIDGKALARPWVSDFQFGPVLLSQLCEVVPLVAVLLRPAAQCAKPQTFQAAAEPGQVSKAGRDCKIVQPPVDHPSQPLRRNHHVVVHPPA